MNAQEIFDKVTGHLLEQDAQAGTDSVCLYRDSENRSCAVGCLIPDEAYSLDMEGLSISQVTGFPGVPIWFEEHTVLLTELQKVHDHWPTSSWLDMLKILAEQRKLKFNH